MGPARFITHPYQHAWGSFASSKVLTPFETIKKKNGPGQILTKPFTKALREKTLLSSGFLKNEKHKIK
jgi:hypothetical protein